MPTFSFGAPLTLGNGSQATSVDVDDQPNPPTAQFKDVNGAPIGGPQDLSIFGAGYTAADFVDGGRLNNNPFVQGGTVSFAALDIGAPVVATCNDPAPAVAPTWTFVIGGVVKASVVLGDGQMVQVCKNGSPIGEIFPMQPDMLHFAVGNVNGNAR